MGANIITQEDLQEFKVELLKEIEGLLIQYLGERPKKWLRTHEVTEMFQISAGTLQNLRSNGTLAYSKLGNILYYDAEHIQRVLGQGQTQNLH
ncbi:DNA-binding protein [Muricauda oceani]|uniref:Helix-turn-helix domain-containing protein n=1 Tax=Flagellimonas oceani TaxID=2698672 RepID=A0A6G7IZQ4_9FLAO|nr:helix-turn-helix domain-containing protein [Allomuricauda oceani]MBW8244270.1 DNA-binding protein [Allomuricauda oceani]QII44083.1 helix-turn-helix domain-containing protein [Allomuricauda oceani]